MADQIAKSRTPTNAAELTVSELAGAIKQTLEDNFGYVRLRGEISGYRGPHASGHCYFALKDDKAKIEAVIWRTTFQRLKIKPEEGLEVIALGRVTTYPNSSKYQIVVEAMEPAGVGALMALLEERKRKLGAEGLFEAARKKPLPFLPGVVGIVTSPTGAVIRDMLAGFTERFPTRVIVWPVRVQGETCAAEVAAAIRGFNACAPGGRIPRPDVLIVARGGGSLEDLWGFNDEAVVRAAAESTIPLISAVGHETDWTLIDLAADARAPTPTKAAEWAVPKHADLLEQTGSFALRLAVGARRCVERHRTELRAVARGLPRPEDIVALPRQRFDACTGRLGKSLLALVQRQHTRLAQLSGRMPGLRSLVVLPRQRFDAVERRLGRALLANTRAHSLRSGRIAARLNPGLLARRIERSRDRLDHVGSRGLGALARLTHHRRAGLERAVARLSPDAAVRRLRQGNERLENLVYRGGRAFINLICAERRRLAGQSQMLRTLSYQSVLQRGFALVRDGAGRPVRSAHELVAGAPFEVELADGCVDAVASGVRLSPGVDGGGGSGEDRRGAPEPATTGSGAASPDAKAQATRPRRSGSPGGTQGSLF